LRILKKNISLVFISRHCFFITLVYLVYLISDLNNREMRNKPIRILLKISVLLIPFSMVYYWELHEFNNRPFAKSLWKYVIAGFGIYAVLAIVIWL